MERMIGGEIDYADAKAELRKKWVAEDDPDSDYESLESAETKLAMVADKLKLAKGERKRGVITEDGDEGTSIYPLEVIPTEWAEDLFLEAADMIREGAYSEDIIEKFMLEYGLSYQLAAYFNNEALSEVRMKTLSQEEFIAVGNAFIEHITGQNAEEVPDVPDPIRIRR
jgi:hypothetical protein